MLNRNAAIARLGREVSEAEEAISHALVSSTALLHTCALAARDNNATPLKVQTAFLKAQKTAESLIGARADIARTHEALVTIYREVAGTEEPYPCPDNQTGFTGAELDEENIAA